MSGNKYNAIFFDLDGTLLPMDVEVFLIRYFATLTESAMAFGYEADRFVHAVRVSIGAMAHHEPKISNADAFWRCFEKEWGQISEREESFFDYFYEEKFGGIGSGLGPNPVAARVINALVEKGYPLYLTTMPFFPRVAVEWRLRWAGVDPAAFDHITVYDNSTSCKPHLSYYQENIERIGIDPSTILMVGNNTEEDLAAMGLGMDVFLVTDYLINANGFDIESVKHGSLAQFADFVDRLPACCAVKGE